MGKLTAAKVRAITRTGLHGDGDTLYLSVAPGGTKSWIQRLTVNGRCRDIGLGGFPLVSLAAARDKAFENRRCARAGGDPLAEKRKVAIPTFRQAAEQTLKVNKPRWRNAQHTKSWWQTLERYAMPRLGNMRVDRIGREDVQRHKGQFWGKIGKEALKAHQIEHKREVTEAEFRHFQRVREGYWRPRFMDWARKSGRSDESIWLPHFLPSATLLDESERDPRPDEAGPTGSVKDSWTR